MGTSFIQLPADSSGKKLRSRNRTVGADSVHEQYVIVEDERVISYRGRAGSFRTPGRGGTAGQNLFAIHNASGSAVLVDVTKITVDVINTATKAIGVEPPLVRLQRCTVLPTGGSSVTKVPFDSALTSSASVTVFGDASADKTLSGTALAVTKVAGFISQEYGPRNFTAVGQEGADRMEFIESTAAEVTLRALEGVVVFLDYNTATFNPATDFWVCTAEWLEYTLP